MGKPAAGLFTPDVFGLLPIGMTGKPATGNLFMPLPGVADDVPEVAIDGSGKEADHGQI